MDEETQLVRESDRIDHRINYVPFILGIFAFFYFFRPSSPFLVEYLVQYKGLDVNTVIFEILPIWSYSYVIVQLVTGFATEWLNHKVIIIVGLFVAQISEIFVLVSDKSKTYLLQVSICKVDSFQRFHKDYSHL
jgi:sugar phosphate permease